MKEEVALKSHFVLVIAVVLVVMPALVVGAAEVKDPDPPVNVPAAAPESTGGPDAFGYTYSDQAEADVAFDWIDITATGAPVVSGDDAGAPVTLGAPFTFYGVTYTEMAMATNGYLSTDPTDTGPDLSNDCPLPATPSTGGGARIYPLQDDLITAQGYYEFFGQCPRQNGRCGAAEPCSIFFWDGVTHYGGTAAWQMEVVLYHSSGDIVAQVGPGNPETGSGSTTGIQNDGATIGLTYACDAASSVGDNTAVRFENGPVPSFCAPPVPTLSPWGIAAFLAILAGIALVILRRR
jgi:hypothetical protein